MSCSSSFQDLQYRKARFVEPIFKHLLHVEDAARVVVGGELELRKRLA